MPQVSSNLTGFLATSQQGTANLLFGGSSMMKSIKEGSEMRPSKRQQPTVNNRLKCTSCTQEYLPRFAYRNNNDQQ